MGQGISGRGEISSSCSPKVQLSVQLSTHIILDCFLTFVYSPLYFSQHFPRPNCPQWLFTSIANPIHRVRTVAHRHLAATTFHQSVALTPRKMAMSESHVGARAQSTQMPTLLDSMDTSPSTSSSSDPSPHCSQREQRKRKSQIMINRDASPECKSPASASCCPPQDPLPITSRNKFGRLGSNRGVGQKVPKSTDTWVVVGLFLASRDLPKIVFWLPLMDPDGASLMHKLPISFKSVMATLSPRHTDRDKILLHTRVVQRVNAHGRLYGEVRYPCMDISVSYHMGDNAFKWISFQSVRQK